MHWCSFNKKSLAFVLSYDPQYLSIIIPSICVLCIIISLQVYSPPLICYLMPSFPVIEPLCPISPEKKEGDQLSQDLAQWSRCANTGYKVQETMVQMCIVQLWQFQSLSCISWDEGLDHQFTLIQNRPFALTRIQPFPENNNSWSGFDWLLVPVHLQTYIYKAPASQQEEFIFPLNPM